MKIQGRPKQILYPTLSYGHSYKTFCETLIRNGVVEVKGLGRFEIRKMKVAKKYNNFADKVMNVGGGDRVFFKACDQLKTICIKK